MKPWSISERQLKKRGGEILRLVEAGETVRITRNGVEIAEIRPLPASTGTCMKVVLEATRNLTPGSLADLRTDADEFFRRGRD